MSGNSSQNPPSDNGSQSSSSINRRRSTTSSSNASGAVPCNPTPLELHRLLHLPGGTSNPEFPSSFPVRDANGRQYDGWVYKYDPAAGEHRWSGANLSDPPPPNSSPDPNWTVLTRVPLVEPVETPEERRMISCPVHLRCYCRICFRSDPGYLARCMPVAFKYHYHP